MRAVVICLILCTSSLSGCLEDERVKLPPPEEPSLPDGTFVTGPDGLEIEGEPLPMDFVFSDVGEEGAEPSIGVTSSGCIFFIAFEKPMRSCDHGETWVDTSDITQAFFTNDPYGWVDPITDRVFNIHMMGLWTTWIGWSDDDGETWAANPHDSGAVPINDHIKLGSGPWTDEGYGVGGDLTSNYYETAVYFCFNKLLYISCYTSYDGGATFEAGGDIVGLATTNGGLHGAITTAPDGTVYLPPRVATPAIIFSKDNGLTWEERTMGEDVGTPNPRKNGEVATDTESNAYNVWVGVVKVGRLLWIVGHSGPETAEDSRTHFGIFAPGVTQLFPTGHIINLHPWEHNDVAPALAAAFSTDVPIVALHLTRPAIEIPDREKLGIASHFEASKGAYLIRDYDNRPKEGVVIVRGTSSTNTIVSILEQIDSEYNVKIVSAVSWELFRRQDQAYKDSIISETEWSDSMIVTNTGLRIMHNWISNRIVSEYSVSPDWDDNWRSGGSLDEIIDEAHLSPRWVLEAIQKFASERNSRLERLNKQVPSSD